MHNRPHRRSFLALVFGCMIGTVWGQDTVSPRGGLELRRVSAYFDYYSAGLPIGSSFRPATKLLSDAGGGATAQLGWTRPSSSFTYTSSVIGRIRYTGLNAWNHALSLTTRHRLAHRWNFGFSASGDISTLEQSLFSPTTLSNASSVRATFDDLAAGILASKFTNPQLASVLTSAPLAESPVRNLLYGERVLATGVHASVSYLYSTRLSVTFDAGGNRMQPLSSGQPGTTRNPYLILNTTSGNAGLAISYSLAPRTQLGGSVTTTRISSLQQDAYITTSQATLGWTVARRWLIQVHGGVGITNPIRQQQLYLQSGRAYPSGGGSLGYKTFSHTLLGSFDRSVSDQYGLGASSSSSASASWRWDRPGRRWWMESVVTWERLYGNSSSETFGWRSSTGFGQRIGRHFAILTQYAYLSYAGLLQASRYSLSQSAVRVSLVWSPR